MNFYKEILKNKNRLKCCCGSNNEPPKVKKSYPTPAAAQSDPTLEVGELYFIDGTVPGSGFKGEVYVKY